MSTTIDERVVSLQFDNQHFEKNVSTTMSTLDKLKQKLQFSDAGKGLEGLEKASGKVTFSGMTSAAETVGLKISAWTTICDQTLRNMVNAVEREATKIVKALTVDPISDGFSEYEMTLNAVQTTMAGTGKTAEEVETELKRLDEYADKTVYSTADMLNNLPKFTNAGVELEKATTAMIGIANATALAGGDAGKASIAFYNLGQAIGTGYLTRMDYNSINNAGIATMEWKNQMVEAAIAQGTLTKVGEDAYKAGNKTLTLQQLFIDGLQEQWATTDVMMKVFGDYGDETTEIGKKAYSSAQDIKTFSQMMESLKATAGTGWKDTWQLIFGGLDEAKEFWTGINNVISGVINKMNDFRNDILNSALGRSFTDLSDRIQGVVSPVAESADAVKSVVDALVDYTSLADDIIKGNWGNGQERRNALAEAGYDWAYAQNLVNEKLGDSTRHATEYQEVQEELVETQTEVTESDAELIASLAEMSDAQLKFKGYNDDQIEALRELEKQAEKTGIPLKEFVENIENINGRFLLIESFKNIGNVLSDIFTTIGDAWNEVFENFNVEYIADKLYDTIAAFHKFTKSLTLSEDASDKLKRTFAGLFSALKLVSNFTGGAFKIALRVIGTILDGLGMSFLDVTAAIGDAVVAFTDWVEAHNPLTKAAEILLPIIETIVDVLGDVISTVKTVVSKAMNPISKILGALILIIGKVVSAFASLLGKAIEPLGSALSLVMDIISGLAILVGDVFSGMIDIIGEWVEAFEETEIFKTVSGYFEDGSEAITGALESIKEGIDGLSFETVTTKIQNAVGFLAGIGQKIGNNKFVISVIDNIAGAFSAFIGLFKDFDFSLPKINFDTIIEFFTGRFQKFINIMAQNNLSGITGVIKGLFLYIKSFFTVKKNEFKNGLLPKFADFFNKFGDKILAGFEKAKEVVAKVAEFLFGSEDVKLPDILAVIEKFLMIAVLIKSLNILNNITGSINNVAKAFKQWTKAKEFEAISDMFKSMAIALIAVTACIYVINNMFTEDPNKTLASAGILVGILAVMGLIAAGLMLFGSKIKGELNLAASAGSILMLAASLALIVWALKTIDATEFKNLKKSFSIMAGALLTLALSIGIIGKLCGGTTIKAAAAIITMLTALKMIPGILEQYAEFPWNTVKKGIPAMITVLLGLAVVCRIMTVASKEGSSAAGTALLLIALVLSLKMMLDVIEELGNKDPEAMWQGIKGVLAILGGITLMLVAMNLSNKGKVLDKGQKAFNSFTGLATALLAVAATIWILGKMDIETLKQGGIAVAAILGIFTIMMYAAGKASNGGSGFKGVLPMLIGMGVIIAEVAFILYLLRNIDGTNALLQMTAISEVILAISGCLMLLTKYGKDARAKDIYKWIGALAVMSLIVGELAGVLWMIRNVEGGRAIAQMTAMTEILAAMGGCLWALSKYGKDARAKDIYKWIGALAVMSAVMVILAGVLGLMQKMDVNGANAIGQATALSVLLYVVANCMIGLAKLKDVKASSILPWVGALMIFSSVLVILAAVLGLMQLMNIDGGAAIAQVTALSILLVALSGCLYILAKIGPMAAGATAAMKALAIFATGLIVFLTILGGINELTDGGFANILDQAILIMTKLGQCIGAFFGGIAKGAIEAVSSTLPQLGTDLSSFMNNASDFFAGLKNISGGDVAKAGFLVGIIGALEYLGLANGILNLFSIGHSLPTLGSDLGAFMTNATSFFGQITDLDEGVMNATKLLAETILILTAAEFVDGITRFIGGSSDLSEFGTKAAAFGESLKAYADSVSELTDTDAENIERSAEAGKKLAELADVVPNEGGLLGKIMGENDMKVFGKKLAAFGESLLDYAESVEGITETDAENITRSAEAGTALANMAGAIPNEGGWLADIMGENDMKVFGKKLVAFAKSLKDYAGEVEGIDETTAATITRSADAGTALCNMADAIPNEGGWFSGIMGENDMAAFGESLVAFGESLVAYSDKVSGLDESDATAINNSKACVEALVALADAIPTTGGWGEAIFGGTDLGEFGTGMSAIAQAMVDCSNSASQIDDTDAENITNMITVVGDMAYAANKLTWVSDGTVEKLTPFADGVSGVAGAVKSCLTTLDGLSLTDLEPIGCLKVAIEALSEAAKAIPNEGGLVALIAGDNADVATFGSGIATLAGQIKECLTTLDGLSTTDLEPIGCLKAAIEALSEAAKAIPNEGGLVALLAGDNNDVATFGSGMVTLAGQVKECLATVDGLTVTKLEPIGCLKAAIEALSEAAKAIPNEGGLVALLAGDNNDVATFGSGMVTLAGQVKECLATVDGLTVEKLEPIGCLKAAIEALAEAAKAIPNEGGLVALIAGDNSDTGGFGAGMAALAGHIVGMLETIGVFGDDDLITIATFSGVVKTIADAADSIGNEGGIWGYVVGAATDPSVFGAGMVTLAGQINTIVATLTDFGDDDKTVIETFKGVVTTLADAADAIGNEGGLWGDVVGEATDPGTFGSGMATLATKVVEILDTISIFEDTGLEAILNRIATFQYIVGALATAANVLGSEGGFWDKYVAGEAVDPAEFGSGMYTLADKVTDILDIIDDFGDEDITTIATFKTILSDLAAAADELDVDDFASDSVATAITNLGDLKSVISGMSGIDSETVSGFTSALSELGESSIDSFIDAISDSVDDVKTSMTKLLTVMIDAIKNKNTAFYDAAKALMTKFANGIKAMKESTKTACTSMMSTCVTAIRLKYSSFKSAGKYLGAGLVEGINSKKQAAYDAGYALGQKAVQGEKDGQQSASPSKATIKAGKWLGEGLVIGIQKMGNSVYSAGKSMGETATDSISGALNTALSLINGDMEAQPTIRPVVDLSDVSAGASAISGMFGLSPSVGVMSNVGAINSMMNSRIQNGANYEIVSAIDKLRKDIGNIQGNSYTVNGITYDDGSNISNAVQSLVRAARVERRI